MIFYGLSSVFMAILNTRNVFGPPAWAPVVNNVVAIATLGAYLAAPGQLSVDPVQMGNAKLLVLGHRHHAGGVRADRGAAWSPSGAERISLRPLWGIDDRLKQFGAMAAAMVFYVLISQIGLVVTNQIASTAAASGPAIYNYTWLVLMLPYGMIGVTVLTVVMPRLSRNAAADDTDAVLADLSLATRLTMITLIPTVAFMTVGGSAMGSALFAYGHFGDVDAGHLGAAIAMSAFTLLPYAVVLLQLRVFYARQQPWIPIAIIVVITVVKIAGSLVAPHLTDNPELVAGYLGLANGLGFVAGAIAGYLPAAQRAAAPRRSPARRRGGADHPGHGHRVAVGRSGRIRGGRADGHAAADRLRRRRRLVAAAVRARGDHGCRSWRWSCCARRCPRPSRRWRCSAAGSARHRPAGKPRRQHPPECLRRHPAPPSSRSARVVAPQSEGGDQLLRSGIVTYPEHRNSSARAGLSGQREPIQRGHPEQLDRGGDRERTGDDRRTIGQRSQLPRLAVTGSASSSAADDFQPDVPTDLHVGTVAAPEASPPPNGEPSDPDLETTASHRRRSSTAAPDPTRLRRQTNSSWSPAPASPAVATGCWSSMAGRRTPSSGRHWTPR